MSITEILDQTRNLPTSCNNEECKVLCDTSELQVYLPHTREAAKALGVNVSTNNEKMYIIKTRAETFLFIPSDEFLTFDRIDSSGYCIFEEEWDENGNSNDDCTNKELGEEYDDIILGIREMRAEYISMLVYNTASGYEEIVDTDHYFIRLRSLLARLPTETLTDILHTRLKDSRTDNGEHFVESITCTLLLDAGASAGALDKYGRNALYYYDSPEAVRMLIAAGADANIVDYQGISVLDINGFGDYSLSKDTVHALLDAQRKYDTHALGKLLFSAITSRDIQYLEMLLAAGADHNVIMYNCTPLQYVRECYGGDEIGVSMEALLHKDLRSL